MRPQWSFIAAGFALLLARAVALEIQPLDREGGLRLYGTFANGVAVVERASQPDGPWQAESSWFTTGTSLTAQVEPGAADSFFRASAVDLPPTAAGFSNFVYSYSRLTTLAGAGGAGSTANKWRSEFEGGPASAALLSRPHIALGDDAGNIYVADKESHAIRRVTPDGHIFTHAGTGVGGDGPDAPTPALEVDLLQPNGCWVRADGTVYVLDTGNGKVRRVNTAGLCETLFTVPGGLSTGRGLWMRDDEALAYACAGSSVKKWTPAGGVVDFATGFNNLGNLAVDLEGRLCVTDLGGNRVYRLDDNGSRTVIAGNGLTTGGGEGQAATATGLNGVRGIWFVPTGGFLLSTASGSQVWYVDSGGTIHLLLHGASPSGTHAGDGEWFYAPTEPRISETRAVTMDRQGNILVTENDRGYIRRIEFLPWRTAP